MRTRFRRIRRGEFDWNLMSASMVPKANMKLGTNPSDILGDAVVLHLYALMRSILFSNSSRKLAKRIRLKEIQILRSKASERNLSKMYRLYRHLESLGSGQHAAASGQLLISRQSLILDLESWNVGKTHLRDVPSVQRRSFCKRIAINSDTLHCFLQIGQRLWIKCGTCIPVLFGNLLEQAKVKALDGRAEAFAGTESQKK